MTTDTEQQRLALRKRVIEQRGALSDDELTESAQRLSENFASTPEYRQAGSVAAYWPVRGEADVRPLMEWALEAGKRVYLPIVGDDGLLRFAPYDRDSVFENNRLGIPEPQVTSEALVDPHDLELVIVPLTVFDDRGNRLGMGGGFYDRSFAFLNGEPARARPILAGAAHEFQRAERLPTCDWDIPARLVVTEQHIWRPATAGQDATAS